MSDFGTNPYDPPSLAAPLPKEVVPHGTSVGREARRGAIFGAKVTAIPFVVLTAIQWLVLLGRWVTGQSVEHLLPPLQHGSTILGLAASIASGLFGIALAMGYGAVVGAFVMAVAASVRKLRRRAVSEPESPND